MGLGRRVSNLWRRKRLDEEIDAELAAHIELAVEDLVRGGVSEAEARRMARVRFRKSTAVKERVARARMRRWGWMCGGRTPPLCRALLCARAIAGHSGCCGPGCRHWIECGHVYAAEHIVSDAADRERLRQVLCSFIRL